MGRPRRMRDLVGVLKDKVSIIKATLILSSKPTSLHVAVLQATTHHPTEPPPEYTLDKILSLGRHHRPTAIHTVLLRRLQGTHSAFVAIKCLLTLHHILRRGSPLLKDQISTGTHLNLATFRDESDSDTLELSKWARWYAEVIQQSLIVSDALSFRGGERISISGTNLLRELNSLVGMVEQICRAPDSLHYQRISMVYEVMKLVGEDYRITLREVFARVTQFGERNIEELSDEGVEKLLDDLKRLEDCKEKAFLMFLNKKRSDGTWESIAQLRMDVEEVKQRRESLRLVTFQGRSGSTRLGGPQLAESRSVVPRGKRWLDVEWNSLHKGIGPR